MCRFIRYTKFKIFQEKGGAKGKKEKKKKDPNCPKKPLSSYMLWLQEMRPSLKKKYPELSITEMSKKAGQLWKELKDKSVREMCMELHVHAHGIIACFNTCMYMYCWIKTQCCTCTCTCMYMYMYMHVHVHAYMHFRLIVIVVSK